MKQFLTFLTVVFITATTVAQVGINNETPDASAALDITSTTRGLFVPRMTAAQRDAITSPSQGLIIFCTDCASGEGELQVKLTSSWKNLHTGGAVNDPPEVGDFYQGGIVFHLFVAGDTGYVAGQTHGLISAPSNQSNSAVWGTAVSICANLTLGGYSDWFLPSKDELSLMYQNKSTIDTTALANGGSIFPQTSYYRYWSSTDFDNAYAWNQDFSNGDQLYNIYNFFINVRAVRAF